MTESDLTPEELFEIELGIPAYLRKPKIDAKIALRKRLEDPAFAGGTFSELDPINPCRLKEFGVFMVKFNTVAIREPGKN